MPEVSESISDNHQRNSQDGSNGELFAALQAAHAEVSRLAVVVLFSDELMVQHDLVRVAKDYKLSFACKNTFSSTRTQRRASV
jgi:hypothetical protein